MADSTINDADLMRGFNPDSALISDTFRPNSPKRPSLDERLEKELGIKVRHEANGLPDFSKPPPGYLPPSTANAVIQEPLEENHRFNRVGNMLQIVPESEESTLKLLPSAALLSSAAPEAKTAPKLEESKAEELMRKLDEQKKRKEAERKLRREKKLAERQNKQQLESEEQSQATVI